METWYVAFGPRQQECNGGVSVFIERTLLAIDRNLKYTFMEGRYKIVCKYQIKNIVILEKKRKVISHRETGCLCFVVNR